MNFEAFHPFVLPYVGRAPLQTVDHALRQSAIELCGIAAHLWIERLDTLLAEPYQTEYALPLDDQVTIVKLLRVTVDDRDVTLIAGGPDGVERRRTYVTDPTAWLIDRTTLNVVPVMAKDTPIDVWVGLKPSQKAFELPERVFEHHMELVARGALARLYSIPGQPWTDLNLAEFQRTQFLADANSAARGAERGFTRRSTPDPRRRFF